jgi:hypothetical protein
MVAQAASRLKVVILRGAAPLSTMLMIVVLTDVKIVQ